MQRGRDVEHNGHLVPASATSPDVATCPACGGEVRKRYMEKGEMSSPAARTSRTEMDKTIMTAGPNWPHSAKTGKLVGKTHSRRYLPCQPPFSHRRN